MAEAPTQNEKMPHRVVVGHPLQKVEDHTEAVEETSQEEPSEEAPGKNSHHRLKSADNEPPHEEVESDGDPPVSAKEEALPEDPCHRQAPDRNEELPPQFPA